VLLGAVAEKAVEFPAEQGRRSHSVPLLLYRIQPSFRANFPLAHARQQKDELLRPTEPARVLLHEGPDV
jgi:hypothetical protein